MLYALGSRCSPGLFGDTILPQHRASCDIYVRVLAWRHALYSSAKLGRDSGFSIFAAVSFIIIALSVALGAFVLLELIFGTSSITFLTKLFTVPISVCASLRSGCCALHVGIPHWSYHLYLSLLPFGRPRSE